MKVVRITKNKFVRAFFNRCCQGFIYTYQFSKVKGQGSNFSYHLTFDVDLEEDHKNIKMILDFLKENKSKANFAVVGKWVEKYPEIYREMIKEGHELINHSYSHPYSEYFNKKKWNSLSRKEKVEEIKKNHEIVSELGYEMKCFRMPHFGKQIDKKLYDILKEIGYKASSSYLSIDATRPFPYKKYGITEIPIANCPNHPFTALDSYHSIRKGWHSKKEFLNIFEKAFNYHKKLDIPFVVYVDPVDMDVDILRIISKNSDRLGRLWE